MKSSSFLFVPCLILVCLVSRSEALQPTRLRCEYVENPRGIDVERPRLSWQVESEQRGCAQSAYRILVASTPQRLANDQPDLWDSGRVESDQTLFIPYEGEALNSRQNCHWKVQVWSNQDEGFQESEPALWSIGLRHPDDWTAKYISYRDESPVFRDTRRLHLPAARQYRKEFSSPKNVKRATIYASALGIYELHLNGNKVGDALFAPGWTNYHKRAYYNTYDVTDAILRGENALGAWVADGWYSGYVGFGLLTGMGTEKTGRSTYGKTPALLAQLEIEYQDGSVQRIETDATWRVTGNGPIQEADLLMGESYDARKEMNGWSSPGFDDRSWEKAILATNNPNQEATFFQRRNPTRPSDPVRNVGESIQLGFRRPTLEAFPGVPVRVTEEISPKSFRRHRPGTYIFDLGQNIAGAIRLKVKGDAGQRIRIRYGEMLHPDGRLMTENLRKARATDYYTCKGDPEGEVYEPRFTFHGFQYVELDQFPSEPTTETVTGRVMHSDTALASQFECSDSMVNQLHRNVVWTQRANFLDLPTDCPQRDERMGWTGDAQAYIATAAYNADIGAFYTKWLKELMASQRPSGAFPGYAPFPFQHGWDFGTAWADAGVICPWTIWQFYGDTRVIEDCWEPMERFMKWRMATCVDDLGIVHGNPWGDWLAQGQDTPLDYIDTIYLAISSKMMSEMAEATGRRSDADLYQDQFERTKRAFQAKYVLQDGSLRVPTQTAFALALFADLVPEAERVTTGRHLAGMLAANGNHMATGFLGSRPLLPALSSCGQHDLATFLLQSREFPSWGYEISNGATTIWERWDSYTKEDAFGRHNAAMNSFSHYAFGAVCEWMFASLAGIRSDGPGFKQIIIHPMPPAPGSNADHVAIDWVRASYDSIRGQIRSDWKLTDGKFHLQVTIPANTKATVYLPTNHHNSITESNRTLAGHPHVRMLRQEKNHVLLSVDSGSYQWVVPCNIKTASKAFRAFQPPDRSMNPEGIDLSEAIRLHTWDFNDPEDLAKWDRRNNLETRQGEGHVTLSSKGPDPQMATVIDRPNQGSLVIELRAMPHDNISCQFFWAQPGKGFNGNQQCQRRLRKSDAFHDYLFSIPDDIPIKQLRFDPFETFDPHSEAATLSVDSISVYQLNQ